MTLAAALHGLSQTVKEGPGESLSLPLTGPQAPEWSSDSRRIW